MGKVHLPYVQRVVSKGRAYYRYRRNGQLIALPPDPTSHEFAEAYNRIHASFDDTRDEFAILPGSIAELVILFKKSAEYKELAPRTRELYDAHLADIHDKFGRFSRNHMSRKVALAYRDSYAETPGKANNSIKVLSRLYSWAEDRTIIKFNFVRNIKKLKMGSHRSWTEEEIKAFEKVAPPYLKVGLALALYTSQRESDIIRMAWNKYNNNTISVKQQKGGAELVIPAHPKLIEVLEAEKKRQRLENKIMPTTILATRNGKPYGRGWFVAEWIENKRKAELPEDCVFHGLRATASNYLAEAGCSDSEIQAITGHKTRRMVEHYTRGAKQKIMAEAAIKKFERKK